MLPAVCLFMVILLISFCKKVNDKNPALLGHWHGTEWLVEGKPNTDADMVQFDFMDDGTYKAQLGSGYSEVGTWRTESDKLYTTATGKQEIMVKLVNTSTNSLTFDMNRSGRKETLTLAR